MANRNFCLVLGLFASGLVSAQSVGTAWRHLGPAPAHGGQVEGIANREVSGAINALAAHPSNAGILYAGAVNGGVWRTDNATAASPNWIRLTDGLGSLSIAALEFDLTDASSQTLVAGVARTSSLASEGGAQIGMLRSTDRGATWAVLVGANTLTNRPVVGVAARGAVLLAATSDQGIYRSSNSGAQFTLISGGAGTGLPAGGVIDLSSDPSSVTRLYATVFAGVSRGLYRSNDSGATWSKTSDAAVDALMAATPLRTEIAVGASGQVFLAVVASNGRLAEVFRSANGAGGWTALGVPTTAEQNGIVFGVNPGGQGRIHLSIAADPTDSNIVYIGGDRQPYFGEGVSGSNQFWPNSIGARDYSGRLFRGNASQPAGSRWAPLTHSGAANNSSPHADSRDMVFDAQGNLLQADDGGVYKRVSPLLGSGVWLSLNGTLATTEYHGIAWDALNDRAIGGAQDTGTTEQRSAPGRIFDSVSTGDGGDPVVEDRASATVSTRYSSFQGLAQLRRRTFNAANAVTTTAFPARTPLNGAPAISAQFYTPLAVNDASATRLLIGAGNGVYESADRGDSVDRISTATINAFRGDPLIYGLPGNPDFILFGSLTGVFLRTSSTVSTAVPQVGSLPGTVVDVAVDPAAPSTLFGVTATSVHLSSNSGTSFSAITGNLISAFSPGTLRTMALVPSRDNALVVASNRGVYVSFAASGYTVWSRLGHGLPNAVVFELEYDRTDDLLLAGTLGRGAWILRPAISFDTLFRDGVE